MLHIVHLIQRRHPEHAGKLLAAVVAMTAMLLASGVWTLAR